MDFVKSEYHHSEITGKVLGAAFEVHKVLGCGFSELVYQRALEVEFRLRQILFVQKKRWQYIIKMKKCVEEELTFL